jgi:pimeloyl-ACP methyl ester carboxylesterase
MSSRPTIVLVHGAFANAGCWSKLIPLLRAKGFPVVASHCPLSSLADDVAIVRQTIKMQNGPVLLVGHSWGGAVITKAGNEPQVRGLVYIAAAAPDSGQSFNDWWKDYPAAPGAPEIKPYGADRFVLTLEGFRRHFAQDLATDESELLYCTQGPFAAAANNEVIPHAAWRDKQSWFIMGEQDDMLTIDLERDTARRMGAKALVLQSSHVPMISHPGEVADFIESAAIELSNEFIATRVQQRQSSAMENSVNN